MNCLRIQTSEAWRPEKEYTFHVLLTEMLGVAYQVDYQPGEDHFLRLPNGAELKIKDEFPKLQTTSACELTALLHALSPVKEPIPDIFAATFFMLTRWEETISSRIPGPGGQEKRDLHGRFPANQSLAWQKGFLNRPVVNEWADQLWEALLRLGWNGERKQRKFQFSVSCDVDHPRLWWSVADRVKTLAGALFIRRDLREVGYWMKNHVFQKSDPYDVFDEWLDLFEKNQLVVQFNFMGERPRSSDCWYPLRHPFVKNLIEKIVQRGHKIGFHPSYEAFDNQAVFDRELASLQAVTPTKITAGRQHYLRFSAPQTWQVWEAAGKQEDSTLGYPEAEGFRCGICQDFPVFDTIQRKMLHLREKPLIAMDVTLAQYRRYTPDEALEHLLGLYQQIEKHQGDFTLLWHNSSWNTPLWKDWKKVFSHMVLHHSRKKGLK